jgi:hypothetical protein
LVFYKRMREQLEAAGTAVLVMTVRIDTAVGAAFRDAGLPPGQFATRYDLRDTRLFLTKVQEILARKKERVGDGQA